MSLCIQKRGTIVNQSYLTADRVELIFELPMGEIVFDFYDKLHERKKFVNQFIDICFEKIVSLFLLPFRLLVGLRVRRLHTMYIQRLCRGNSRTRGLVGHFLLYRQLLQLI